MLRWDIFCRVIDNFGDIGVCWRLSCALAKRGHTVRLWADDASALAWMAPDGCSGVEVRCWRPDQPMPHDAQPGDVVIEAFGCEIDHAWFAMNTVANYEDSMPANPLKGFINPVWINLEYLSAEDYVERSHGLSSPVLVGAAQGRCKWFFYPGFTARTGGLMREYDAASVHVARPALRRISLFCYEPPALTDFLQTLAVASEPTELRVLPGRGWAALQAAVQSNKERLPAWNKHSLLLINEQMCMPQTQYDALLERCDLNFVRGEDSLTHAIWAGRAFVWQIYPQADGAHAAKLEAFLDWLQAPPDLREFHRVWNGLSQAALPPLQIAAWTACTQAARARIMAQRDLVSQLIDFVEEKAAMAQ